MTAARAMQALARRDVLVRKKGAGTTIGPAAAGPGERLMTHIHILTPESYYRHETAFFHELSMGVHDALPYESVQVTFVPEYGQLAFVRSLVEAASEGTRSGFVLLVSAPEVQRYFARQGIPAVVVGSVYPGFDGLPSVTFDPEFTGRALTAHLLEAGHRDLAIVMRNPLRYGDNHLLDGAHAALDEAGLPASTLRVRVVAGESIFIEMAVDELVGGPRRASAILCQDHAVLCAVEERLNARGLRTPDDVALAVASPDNGHTFRYPHLRPVTPRREEGALVGQLLRDQLLGKRPGSLHHVLPVEVAPGWETHRPPVEHSRGHSGA
jgi:DNA-binding LacI/PurR family transcriptional regulator